MFDDSVKIIQHLGHGCTAIFSRRESHAVLSDKSVSRPEEGVEVVSECRGQERSPAQVDKEQAADNVIEVTAFAHTTLSCG